MYVLCFTSNTIKHLLAVKYPNRGNPCWFFFLCKSHGRFLIGYIQIYYNIYSEAMANFMRNWRRPSRVCLYVLSGGCDLQFIYTLLRVNFSVLFLCMSPSRTIICTPKFGKYFTTQNKHTSFISKARMSDTINSDWHDSFFLLSCRPESPTCSAQGASCLSNLAARLLVSSTSSTSSFSHLTF